MPTYRDDTEIWDRLKKPLALGEILKRENSRNLAELIDEEELNRIGARLYEEILSDDMSRNEWKDMNEEWLKLAIQVMEQKTWPWPKASNIKYPLITVAALQFQGRAFKALFGEYKLVKGKVLGQDPDGKKRKKAERLALHMSYQLREQIPFWEEDMDKGLFILPILGNIFKKTYRIPDKNISELVLPQDLIINFYAKNIEQASRITHCIEYYKNEIITRQRTGEWLSISIPDNNSSPRNGQETLLEKGIGIREPPFDSNAPYKFFECHCELDLDGDDYKEPYIVTLLSTTKQIFRIVPNFDVSKVSINSKNEVVEIEKSNIFTNYTFIPHPSSGVYGLGFGALLGPTNVAVNSLINQLVDSGTLNNLPSGFISRGIRVQHQEMPLQAGEFRSVQSPIDDLKKGIMLIPSNVPSQVLFELLGFLVQSGKEVAIVSDTMLGKMPGQNTPFRTTSSVLEQGLMLFSSITKRIFTSFGKELGKLYQLNKQYITNEEYYIIVDETQIEQGNVVSSDYEGDDTDIIPGADPDIISDIQKLQKADELVAFVQLGTVNPQEATRRALEARGHEDIDILMQKPPPQPDFDQQIKLKELELKTQELQIKGQIDQYKTAAQAARDEANSVLAYAKAQSEVGKVELERLKQQYEMQMKEYDIKLKQMDMVLQTIKAETEVAKIEAIKSQSKLKERESKTRKYNPKTKSIE